MQDFEMIVVIFIYYWNHNELFDNFCLQYYIILNTINNTNYIINNTINNNTDHNNNDNNTNKSYNNKVCMMKRNGRNANDIRIIQNKELVTKLLVLIMLML